MFSCTTWAANVGGFLNLVSKQQYMSWGLLLVTDDMRNPPTVCWRTHRASGRALLKQHPYKAQWVSSPLLRMWDTHRAWQEQGLHWTTTHCATGQTPTNIFSRDSPRDFPHALSSILPKPYSCTEHLNHGLFPSLHSHRDMARPTQPDPGVYTSQPLEATG